MGVAWLYDMDLDDMAERRAGALVVEVNAETKADAGVRLLEKASELGVLVCQIPIAHGPLKGKSAQGTRTGYTRHRLAGHRGEEICEPCRSFHAAYVKRWLEAKAAAKSGRGVHAVLSDGLAVVRYAAGGGKWFLEREKGDRSQQIKVGDAVKLVRSDADAKVTLGLPGGAAFDKGLES